MCCGQNFCHQFSVGGKNHGGEQPTENQIGNSVMYFKTWLQLKAIDNQRGRDYHSSVVGNKSIKFCHDPDKRFEPEKWLKDRHCNAANSQQALNAVGNFAGCLIYQRYFIHCSLPVKRRT